ncbi:MAG: outer membrane beta-barrel protein [Bacteroidota bacterium]
MEENFDKKLSSKIKVIIEDQKIPYNPEHWDMLLAKKKKKRRFIVIWRYAATLLILLSVGSLSKFYFTQSDSDKTIEQKFIIGERNDSLKKNIQDNNENIFIAEDDKDILKKNNSEIIQADSITIKTIQSKNDPKNKVIISKDYITNTNKNYNTIKNDVENKPTYLVNNKEVVAQNRTEIEDKESIIIEQNIVAENKLKKDSLKDINKLIASSIKDEAVIEKNRSRTIKIGVNISSEINYNQEIVNSNLGFAGGISMDFPISKKLDLYSGILYTDQKLNMNDRGMVYDSGPGFISSDNKELKSEKVVLKGIEIPINLKYNFSLNDKKVFISSGFSSTYYFKENVETDYIVSTRIETVTQDSFGNNIVEYELEQSNEKIVKSNDNSFNLAKIINLSMGIELPLNKQQQSIVLEPYFKYSIKPVTGENIDFSSAGIFLRYNFSFYKK